MFTDKIELKDFDKMDPEYQDLLRRVLTIQCDCEIGGPHLYVESMLPGAPTKSAQLIVARTAAEEIDHFRKMAKLASDIGAGAGVAECLTRSNETRYVEAFRTHITTWEDYAVFGFLVDRVGKYQLDEFIGCSYLPVERAVMTMLVEEEGHIEYGTVVTAEMAAKGGEQKDRVQKSVDYWYAKSLDMFGNSGSYRSERFRYWGLKRRSNQEAREEYIAEVNPLIEKAGLTIPDPNEGRLYF